jgi:hypothetical protein
MPKIQKSLLWLERYLKLLRNGKLVDLNKVYAIRAFKLPVNKMEQTLAQCTRLGNNKHYVITLRAATHKQEEKIIKMKTTVKKVVKNVGYKTIPIREILSDVAHELAHISNNFDNGHTVEHEIFTTKIYLVFLKQLEKDVKSGLIKEREA